MTGWLTKQTSDGAHVLPVDDLVEHAESNECVCIPRVEHMTRNDGSDGWVTVHHSLDGRELTEQGHA